MDQTDSIRIRVEEILSKHPSYGTILVFFESVLGIMAREDLELESGSEVPIFKSIPERSPILKRTDFRVNQEAVLRVFHRLVNLAPQENEYLASGLKRLKESEALGKLDLDALVQAFLREDDEAITLQAEELGLEASIMKFVLAICVRPTVERKRRQLECLFEKEWNEGICPVCGSLPLLSEFKGTEGKRWLNCSFCGHRWCTVRLGCPFCGTKDHTMLKYLYVEDQEGLRVDLCDGCKRYIKTLDLTGSSHEPNPLLEDLASLHLDLIAQNKGYTRGAPDPWGVI